MHKEALKLLQANRCPENPKEEDFDVLANTKLKFEDAVAPPTPIQQAMMILRGWLCMEKDLIKSPPCGVKMSKLESIPKAYDSLMGMWVNGVDKEMAAWLCNKGVPCGPPPHSACLYKGGMLGAGCMSRAVGNYSERCFWLAGCLKLWKKIVKNAK
ncbi:hypothetical protein BDP27DRAFT_1365602 [Rhodocollybia butyracea]|uniref:Uncharacterized protein n=1 Tax=Rhodocollybia butyracea TaxID=206335 RepID=A0A9P5PND4_9AGAR|nr:hypothetical protein BDP27DRAFT_1365602 [Rhodocollybia butyracea]